MLAVDLSQQALQSKHLLPCFELGHVTSSGLLDTVDVWGQLFTGPWSTNWPENLIIKLSGHKGKNDLTHASLVGIQCLVSGVSLQTAKIFSRCCSSWTSPLSCHRNSFDFFELINRLIAPTHSGLLMLASLLYCASWTGLNLYIPFNSSLNFGTFNINRLWSSNPIFL